MRDNCSASYFKHWGKVAKDPDGNVKSFHLLPYHCLDVAAVGHVLMNREESWLRRLTGALPLNREDARRVLLLFLCLHDAGKFSSSFQEALGSGLAF